MAPFAKAYQTPTGGCASLARSGGSPSDGGLPVALDELVLAETAEYEASDEDLAERGILTSGLRGARYVAISDKFDREREERLRNWRRRLEDLGVEPADPPQAATTFPQRFTRDGVLYDRTPNPADQPIRCGHCGRLVYMAGDEAVSWWCPEHEYDVS